MPNAEVKNYLVNNLLEEISRLCSGLARDMQLNISAFSQALVQHDKQQVALTLGQCLNQLSYHERPFLQNEFDFVLIIRLMLKLHGYQVFLRRKCCKDAQIWPEL